jgi:hypothetical protein
MNNILIHNIHPVSVDWPSEEVRVIANFSELWTNVTKEMTTDEIEIPERHRSQRNAWDHCVGA